MLKKIKSALISVYYKDQLEPIINLLQQHNIKIYSTGGTLKFIEQLGVTATAVEDLTMYPSIFGGRVKTLHPKVFGGILHRRENTDDRQQVADLEIPEIDLVIVDLYPFADTLAAGASHEDIIEKIDIGGISLIRAAAKNFKDVLIVSSRKQYSEITTILDKNEGASSLEERQKFAAQAFSVTSDYDTSIFKYFNREGEIKNFKQSIETTATLRYGENPHQDGYFHGELNDLLQQLNGKPLSYNNLVDIDAAINLIEEFTDETAFAILKHTNACGIAVDNSVSNAYLKALAADTTSAFGGVLITNQPITIEAAEEMHKLFFEVLIAPDYAADALTLLSAKKNRILLKQKSELPAGTVFKSLLNGVVEQAKDDHTDDLNDLKTVTDVAPSDSQISTLLFASKVCKHTKSNTIVLAKDGQLLASGVGQTSRVDALEQAIAKARKFGFDLEGAVMASDAFFPFPDSVEIAFKAGITAVIQPGGSLKDQDSIDFCNGHKMAMVFTGIRHFKH
jgi:phosphoribosylaminoimidazolecarboxamide formyltransferase/IMP cyclohydrolase